MSVKRPGEVINKLKLSLSTDDFSIIHSIILCHTIKSCTRLIEWNFQSEGLPCAACDERNSCFISEHLTDLNFDRVKKHMFR